MKRKAQLGALIGFVALCAPKAFAQDPTAPESITEEDYEYLSNRIDELSEQFNDAKPGRRSFLVTGYGSGGYTDKEGGDSSFSAGFNPIFLWAPTDDTFFEGEAEFEVQGNQTPVGLEYAQMSHILNDSLMFSLGKFLNPANVFQDRLHPAWINKLPDRPLIISSRRIQAHTELGAQLHGGMPVGPTKINYSLFVSNGSIINTGAGKYGSLSGKDFTDSNNAKEVGGRLGIFVMPKLEVGLFTEVISNVTPSSSTVRNADASIYGFDINYTDDVPGGTLDVRTQWVFSNVENVNFDPDGSQGFVPAALNNTRDGGYVQLAYRPSQSGNDILKKLEGVVRYDAINLPKGAPEGDDESRIALGIDYWSNPASVFKLSYVIDDKESGTNSDAILFQWAVGF